MCVLFRCSFRLDHALENGGDLWQFGTQTLKGFAEKNFDNDELREYKNLLDPSDPLLHELQRPRMAAVDVALANGDNLSSFATQTLKGWAKHGTDVSRTVATELLDRDIAQAAEGRTPRMGPRMGDSTPKTTAHQPPVGSPPGGSPRSLRPPAGAYISRC